MPRRRRSPPSSVPLTPPSNVPTASSSVVENLSSQRVPQSTDGSSVSSSSLGSSPPSTASSSRVPTPSTPPTPPSPALVPGQIMWLPLPCHGPLQGPVEMYRHHVIVLRVPEAASEPVDIVTLSSWQEWWNRDPKPHLFLCKKMLGREKHDCADNMLHLRYPAQCGDKWPTYVWRKWWEKWYQVNRVDRKMLEKPKWPWGEGLEGGRLLVLDAESLEEIEKKVYKVQRYRTRW